MTTPANRSERTANPEPETVFEVGTAGGSLSIRHGKDHDGRPSFTVNRNENALYGLFDEDDREEMVFEENYPPVDAFAAALQSIDHYQWYRMTPITVHPGYLGAVVAEVSRKGEVEDIQRWRVFVAERAFGEGTTTQAHGSEVHDAVRYPDRKQRELSDGEKAEIRERLIRGHADTHALAKEFDCAATQIAGIKAWIGR